MAKNYLYIKTSNNEVWGCISDVDEWNTRYVQYTNNMFNLVTDYNCTQIPPSSSSFQSGYLNESDWIDSDEFYNIESVVEL